MEKDSVPLWLVDYFLVWDKKYCRGTFGRWWVCGRHPKNYKRKSLWSGQKKRWYGNVKKYIRFIARLPIKNARLINKIWSGGDGKVEIWTKLIAVKEKIFFFNCFPCSKFNAGFLNNIDQKNYPHYYRQNSDNNYRTPFQIKWWFSSFNTNTNFFFCYIIKTSYY